MMKKIVLSLLATVLIGMVASAQNPSAGVYLFVPGITANTAVAGHTNEVKLESVQFGAGLAVSTPIPGNPIETSGTSLSEIVVTKSFDVSSLRIYHALLSKTVLGQTPAAPNYLEIRYYNGARTTPVYVIRLDKAVFSGYTSTDAGCSAGCPGIAESISIAAVGTITYRNQAVTPNQVLIYNVANRTSTITE